VSQDLHNWYHERESAWLYGQVAAAEPDPRKRQLFLALAAAAQRQADKWEQAASASPPPFEPQLRARIVAGLLKLVGPRPLRPALAAMKLRGLSIYDSAPSGHPMPTSVQEVGLRHKGVSGGNLRAAVFGVNDGLVSNVSLIMGVAGAGANSDLILMTGVAGLLAGALSMAAGEYVSVRSQREMYEYQIGLERDELAEYPEEEAEELALIYEARGMPIDRARSLGRDMIANPDHALETLAREELGLNPGDLGSPWGAASSSFVSFGLGALVPLLPFIPADDVTGGVILSAVLSGAALLGVGMALSLFTGRSALRGGLRMLLIGAGAALTTYLIGRLVGAAIA
jgi:VIT1/CCC1 family predicted Fe2+/Mn2+ transporter